MVKLNDLINRGDVISITNGQLNITPKSGKPVPSDWLLIYQNTLVYLNHKGLEVENNGYYSSLIFLVKILIFYILFL